MDLTVERVLHSIRWRSRPIREAARRTRRRVRRVAPWSYRPGRAPVGAPKVFGIGLSKTGTTSLYVALDLLGYRSATYRHLRSRKLGEWWAGDFSPDYLADVDAVTDLPIGTMYRELYERYPGSKFILTERSLEPWLDSIERQFEKNRSPGAFAVRTRTAAYGYTVFNRAAFARAWSRHRRDVEEFFADKPDRLLVLNLFDGGGWVDLCGFLECDVPSMPFPDVKPGQAASRSDTGLPHKGSRRSPSSAPDARARLGLPSAEPVDVAMIPVINPDSEKVRDYGEIELTLRRTVASLSMQRGTTLVPVVVGHRQPAWMSEHSDPMVFVDVDLVRCLDGGLAGSMDKGVKTVIAAVVSSALSPRIALTLDADDFVHVDVADATATIVHDRPDVAGVRWTRGAELVLRRWADDTLDISEAHVVRDFDRTCGTSRAFSLPGLTAWIDDALPSWSHVVQSLMIDIERMGADGVVKVAIDTASRVDTAFADAGEPALGALRAIGSHVSDELPLLSVPLFGAAKSCGHGQHEGPDGGRLHTSARTATLDRARALATFGLISGECYPIQGTDRDLDRS